MTDVQSRIAALSAEQRALLEARLAAVAADRGRPEEPILRRTGDSPAPVSFAQQREWALERFRPSNNIIGALRLDGDFDLELLARVLTALTARHEVLRTTVETVDGALVQVVHPVTPVTVNVEDLSDLDDQAQQERLHWHYVAEVTLPFPASQAQRIRATVLRVGPESYVVFLIAHHASSDGWSTGLLMRDAAVLYQALRAGREPDLPSLPIQYGDFAAWQRERTDEEWMAGELEYWHGVLDGIPPRLELPADRPVPARRTFAAGQHSVSLPQAAAQGVKRFADEEGVSVSMIMIAVASVLLFRYTGQDDLVFGTPVSGRTRPEMEQLVGCFANALPLRMRVSRQQTLREVLRQARDVISATFSHQDIPFDRLIEEFAPKETSQTPLIRMMVNVPTIPTVPGELFDTSGEEAELVIRPEEVDVGPVAIDMILIVQASLDAVYFMWHYSAELFEAATVARLAEQFSHVLNQLITAPDTVVGELSLLGTAASRPAVQGTGSSSGCEGVVELFGRQVGLAPDAAAVVCEGVVVSYGELWGLAGGLAGRLRGAGAGREVLVGVLVERGPLLAVAVLGALMAGAGYVPLDEGLPAERVRFLLADSGAGLLVTTGGLAGLAEGSGVPAVLLGGDGAVAGGPGGGAAGGPAVPLVPGAGWPAYVVYTSGSSGEPKGVVVEHGSLGVFAREVAARLQLGAGDRFLQFAPAGFDVLAEELFPVWAAGGAVVFPPRRAGGRRADLAELAGRERVSVMELPAAFWHEWARELERSGRGLPSCLRLVIVGSERVLPERVAAWRRLGVPLMNVYGVTEATCSSTFFRLPGGAAGEADARHLPIGTPLPSVGARVLDEGLAPVPAGAAGELYLSGAGLARGYLGRAGLTAQRFVADPDPARAGRRLYRTGDLVRERADGNLEFLSRADAQLKIRGARVEPAEVESALCRHPQVAQAVVAAWEAGPGDRRLAAYIVAPPRTRPNVTDLRRFLAGQLPDYLVPSAYVRLEALPLTPNGKVDRARLPEPGGERPELEQELILPRTPLERRLAGVIAAVLGITVVGAGDNFFELGGDSILAIQVAARAQEQGIPLAPLDLFEHPTLTQLAQKAAEALHTPRAETADGTTRGRITRRPPDADPVLSYGQERLWLDEQLTPGPAYHVGGQHRLAGPLDVALLERCLRVIIGRHEALRTRFPMVEGRPVQVVDDPDEGWRLPVEDLSGAGDGAREAGARLLLEHAATPFDLARGPLLRCLLVKLSDTEHLFSVASHHIVSDIVSTALFVRELSALYGADGDAARAGLPELPVQYRDFAAWQRGWLAGEELERQVDYWRRHLAGAPPALALPAAAQAPTQGAAGGRVRMSLPPERAAALGELCRRQNATLFMVVLSALATVLSRWSGQRDVVVGVPASNRTDAATENLIGCFINTLPLRVDLSGDPSFTALLGRVREVALGAYAHADAPLDLLVREFNVTRAPNRTPLFQVLLNIIDTPPTQQFGGLTAELVDTPALPSSFDLVLTARKVGATLQHTLEYRADRYQAAMMEALTGQVGALLEAVAADPDRGILDYPLGPAGAAGPQAGGEAGDWAVRELGPGPGDRVAVLSGSPAHRAAAAAAARAAGAALVPGEAPVTAGSAALAGWLRDSEASVAYLTPPVLRALARSPQPQLPALRYVVAENSGDLLSHDVTAVRRLSAACRCAALYRVQPDGTPLAAYLVPADLVPETAPPRVPLGREVAAPARLLHPAGQPAAVGEVAEICIGGTRTGDLGRRWADGTLEYVATLSQDPHPGPGQDAQRQETRKQEAQ